MFDSFESLLKKALDHSNPAEKERICRENEIIKIKSWESYIVFAANVIEECNISQDTLFFFEGSVMDSYLIWKGLNPGQDNLEFMTNNESESSFQKGTLNILTDVISMSTSMNNYTLKILDTAIENQLKKSNFHFWQVATPKPQMYCTPVAGQLIAVSKKELTVEEKYEIMNCDVMAEKTDEFRDVLIIKINVGIGL